jgi:hypothetical protein
VNKTIQKSNSELHALSPRPVAEPVRLWLAARAHVAQSPTSSMAARRAGPPAAAVLRPGCGRRSCPPSPHSRRRVPAAALLSHTARRVGVSASPPDDKDTPYPAVPEPLSHPGRRGTHFSPPGPRRASRVAVASAAGAPDQSLSEAQHKVRVLFAAPRFLWCATDPPLRACAGPGGAGGA